MADLNQSFIRAFAKKDAAAHDSVDLATAEKRPQRRPSAVAKREQRAPAGVAIAEPKPEIAACTLSALLSSESVMVFSNYSADVNLGAIAPPVEKTAWTEDLALAAQSAATQVPRGVASKSVIPEPPKPIAEPNLESKKAVQRIDEAHRGKLDLPKILPAWEVDKLVWPRTCEQLHEAEKSYFDEAARRLVEASKQGMRTLAICESRRGEGCSTVTLCVARAAAAAGMRIGILDADLQGDGLADLLGLEVDCDWTSAAASPAAINENAVQALDQPIMLFPRTRTASITSLKASTKPFELIPRIAEQLDLLIIDFGALSEGALPAALKQNVVLDAALVVRDLRHTSSRAVHATVAQIREAGIEAVGIAENFGAR
jgi:Mrp family chromosome partitioning ATPase